MKKPYTSLLFCAAILCMSLCATAQTTASAASKPTPPKGMTGLYPRIWWSKDTLRSQWQVWRRDDTSSIALYVEDKDKKNKLAYQKLTKPETTIDISAWPKGIYEAIVVMPGEIYRITLPVKN
ncbi:MAG: hypothetical protein JST90_10685 [Bacteroidetes bacterium]|nr:hypothetical protein [Bacteroidota bacterium]